MASPLQESASSPRYFPALDGLRLVCCSAVVLAHSFMDPAIAQGSGLARAFVLNAGRTGVDVFFSLSGFLITKLLLDERDTFGRVRLRDFYIRRTLRIFPIYYLALVIGFGGAAVMGNRWCNAFGAPCSPELFTRALPTFATFLGNWYFGTVPVAIGQLWSVCIEEQFYLLFPSLFVFSRRTHPVFRVIAVGLVVAWTVRFFGVRAGWPVGDNTFAHADNLLLGALVAQTLQAYPHAVRRLMTKLSWVAGFAAVLGVAGFNLWYITDSHDPVEWLAFYAVSAVATSFLVAAIAVGRGPVVDILKHRFLRACGRLTYSAYVFHFYAVALVWRVPAYWHLDPWWAGAVRFALALPLSLAIGYATRRLFERRLLDLKDRFQPLVGVPNDGSQPELASTPIVGPAF